MTSKLTRMFARSLLAMYLVLPSVLVAAEPSVETNVVFGTYSGLALLMDVYKPAMSNGYGIVVIPGSGWHRDLGYDAAMLKQSREFPPAINKLVAAGYTAFVVNHRAAPRFHYQDAADDAQRSVRFIRSNGPRYGIRPDRIGALGGSSGGHLVSLLGTLDGKGDPEASDPVERESSKVQSVVAFYPATDLTKFEAPFPLATVTALMGMRPPSANAPKSSPDVKLYQEASPINHVSSDDPPFLIVHGDVDKIVPYQQSENMEAALRKAGVPVKLIRVLGAGHGVNSAGWDKIDWVGMTLDWFETHLRKSVSESVAR